MELHDEMIKLLEQSRGKYVSGQEIASRLQVSRNAIWKVVSALKQQGYAIDSAPRRGYRLADDCDVLSEPGLRQLLSTDAQQLTLQIFPQIDSTNNEAKRLLAAGQSGPALVLAEQQLSGRGRQGRAFFSPAGSGLYMSFLIQPQAELTQATFITTITAVAVCRAIDRLTGLEAQIKWVNDIFVRQRKVCGILCEAIADFESSAVSGVVIGIGVNVRSSALPPELAAVAGALDAPGLTRNALAAGIANELLPMLSDLGDRAYLAEYRRRSLVLGRDVVLLRNNDKISARALDIDEQGGLVVRLSNGQLETISSGEVSLRFA